MQIKSEFRSNLILTTPIVTFEGNEIENLVYFPGTKCYSRYTTVIMTNPRLMHSTELYMTIEVPLKASDYKSKNEELEPELSFMSKRATTEEIPSLTRSGRNIKGFAYKQSITKPEKLKGLVTLQAANEHRLSWSIVFRIHPLSPAELLTWKE